MNVHVTKPAATIELRLSEGEALLLAQLTGNIRGGSDRAQFYGDVYNELVLALDACGHSVPRGDQYFKGSLEALDIPEPTLTKSAASEEK